MKKYQFYFVLFTFLLVSFVSQAQLRIGLRGGYDIIDHKINSSILNVSNRLGFQLGATAEFLPLAGFGLEMGLLYGHNEYTVEEKAKDASISDFNYISIPLDLKKRIGLTNSFGIFLAAGVYADVKLRGGNLKVAHEEYKSQNFAGGFRLGAGAKLFNSFDLGIYHSFKVTDNFATDKPSFNDFRNANSKSWNVSLAFYFN